MKRAIKRRVILAVLREASELKQQELADRLFVDRNVVSRAELGYTNVSTDFLVDWVEACGGTKLIDWLIDHLRALRNLVDAWSNTNHIAYA
ncbi:MAG: helix-turn-helix transcriptional regulator [Alicyclobacillus sp.]|nr:helix-turn-helix transcriptional regulator [Alicyclobacillus sp.]